MKKSQIFSNIVSDYDTNSILQQEVGTRILKRLDFIQTSPNSILDAGCATGFFSRKLSKIFPKARVLGVDISTEMINFANKKKRWLSRQKFKVLDLTQIPIENHKFDFIFCNLTLPWIEDINHCFDQWKQQLNPEGLLMFSTLGPDSFKELKSELLRVDPDLPMMNFIDMHDIGDALLKNNFTDPVMDTEILNFVYDNQPQMIRELKSSGMLQLILGEKFHPLCQLLQYQQENSGKTNNDYLEIISPQNPEFSLTAEVIYGHAWGNDKLSMSEQKINNEKEQTYFIDASLKN